MVTVENKNKRVRHFALPIMRIGCSSLAMRLFCGQLEKKSTASSASTSSAPDPETIAHAIRRIAELGIRSVDLWFYTESQLTNFLAPVNLRKVNDACKSYSAKIDHIYIGFLHPRIFGSVQGELDEPWSGIGRLASNTNTTTIEILSPPVSLDTLWGDGSMGNRVNPTSWNKVWERYVSSMKEHAKFAQRNGLMLSIESRPSELLSNTDALLRLIEAVDSDNIGGVIDISHLHMVREIIPLSILKLGKRMFCVHLSDNDGITDWHWSPGQGKVDWEPVFEALKYSGYDGVLSLDIAGIDVEQELSEGKQFVESMQEKMNVSSTSE